MHDSYDVTFPIPMRRHSYLAGAAAPPKERRPRRRGAADQLLLAAAKCFTDCLRVVLLGSERDPLRVVHVEVARAGTRRAVPGRVARGLAARASSDT